MWEAFEHAAHFELDNLTAIIDVNRLGQRGETMVGWNLDRYVARAEAFGWNAIEVDGHDVEAIDDAFSRGDRDDRRSRRSSSRGRRRGRASRRSRTRTASTASRSTIPRLRSRSSAACATSTIEVAKPEAGDAHRVDRSAKLELPRYEVGSRGRDPKGLRRRTRRARLGPRPDVVVLDGEVSNSTFAETFAKAHPERFFEMYIAEQQMVAAAVGLQAVGWRPFASTFAAFLSRAYDFVRMAAVSRATLALCGSHAGVSIGEDGPSQMGLEDIASFRAVHGSTVLHPCDANQTAKLVAAHGRPRRDLVPPHAAPRDAGPLRRRTRSSRSAAAVSSARATRTRSRSSAPASPSTRR